MRSSRRTSADRWRALGGLLLVAAVGSVGVVWHYGRIGVAMCRPPRVHVSDADRARARQALSTLEDAELRTDDGLTLRGFYVPSKNGVVVVMDHGLGQNRMRFLRDAEMLARHGYGALFYDSRAHGESEGDAATWGAKEQRDVRAAVDFVTRRAPEGRVATLGFSVGSSAVALEAADDPRVGAVILEAIWPSLDEELRDKAPHAFRRWLVTLGMQYAGVNLDETKAQVRPIDGIGRIAPRPLLMMCGAEERDTPPDILARVFAAAGEPKQIWIVPGADHGTYFAAQPEQYERTVVGFLDRAFHP